VSGLNYSYARLHNAKGRFSFHSGSVSAELNVRKNFDASVFVVEAGVAATTIIIILVIAVVVIILIICAICFVRRSKQRRRSILWYRITLQDLQQSSESHLYGLEIDNEEKAWLSELVHRYHDLEICEYKHGMKMFR